MQKNKSRRNDPKGERVQLCVSIKKENYENKNANLENRT